MPLQSSNINQSTNVLKENKDKMDNTNLETTVKKKLKIRQTLTSKLRLENNNKLLYYKKKLEELDKESNAENVSDTKKQERKTEVLPETKKIAKKPASETNSFTARKVNFKDAKPVTKKINQINTSSYSARNLNISKSFSEIQQNKRITNNVQHISRRDTCQQTKSFTNFTDNQTKNVTKFKKPDIVVKSESNLLKKNPGKGDSKTSNSNIVRFKKPNTTENKVNFIEKNKLLIAQSSTKNSIKRSKEEVNKNTQSAVKFERKSISAVHMKRVTNIDKNSLIHRSKSCHPTVYDELEETNFGNSPMFCNPLMAKRRSIFNATLSSSKYTPRFTSPSSDDLKDKLMIWLKNRGQSLGSYHHLRCFNMKLPKIYENCNYIEEDKENIEVAVPDLNSSYNDLKIINNITEETEEDKKANKKEMLKAALYDLQKLISEGYPEDQCAAWLDLVSDEDNSILDEPLYWECKASIEEHCGNVNNAISCYKEAIIKGANVQCIDDSLEKLLKKFSVLNIKTPNEKNFDKNRERKSVSARNIFRSRVISFAVKAKNERNSRDKQNLQTPHKYVATPVRRSTRKRSNFTTTPGLSLFQSLEDLSPSIRQDLEFKKNKALV